MFSADLLDRAQALLSTLRSQSLRVATAESCTGGLVAALLTEIAGSSDVVDCGFVTYSNAAKRGMLGVAAQTLEAHGAVSEPTAREMALGALARSQADIAVSITGIAGPGGGSAAKPIGLVHVACARRGHDTHHRECRFADNGRAGVRRAAILVALDMLGARAL